MHFTKEKKERIIKVIKELKLSDNELKTITYGDMEKISTLARVDVLDLMWYLRYER